VTTTYAPVDLADVHRMRTALGKLLSTVRRRIPAAWTPAWRSDAEDEVKATSRLLRTDGSPWGESPLSTVFPVSGMLIDTVIQNADAIHMLLESRTTSTLALDAQARAALEAAAQAWWLLEPRLGGRARVARLYVLRRSSAARLEQTAQNVGLPAVVGYGALVQELDDLYQGELGLTPMLSPKGNWAGCENQKPFDYTTRVKAFMEQIGQDPAAGPYACQRSSGNPGGRSCLLRAGGHQFSRLVATCSPGGAGLGCQGYHPLAGEGLGEAVGVALGQDQVGVVE
jgi:hypothetical protein